MYNRCWCQFVYIRSFCIILSKTLFWVNYPFKADGTALFIGISIYGHGSAGKKDGAVCKGHSTKAACMISGDSRQILATAAKSYNVFYH